jgi:thymidylate synthase (FAD)
MEAPFHNYIADGFVTHNSTRYVRYDGGMEFIRPVWCSSIVLGEFTEGYDFQDIHDPDELNWILACRDCELSHINLLERWRPEQAREVLPNSLKTEIVVKGNIREWRHCLTLRTSKKAHPQMRALMLPLLEGLKKSIPIVFDDINKEK